MQVAHCFSHDEDVANVRDMRAALGDGIEIMVDVNQGWGVGRGDRGRQDASTTSASPGWKSR